LTTATFGECGNAYLGGISVNRVGDKVSAVKASAMATFGRQLKAWRHRQGWSQVELGEKISYSDSLISGVENATKTPTADFAQRCDEAFSTPATFVDLQRLVAREALPSYFAPVIDFEARAVRIHEWEMRVIPGLLQTEDYARSVISAGKPRATPEAVDRAVSLRLARQEILTRDESPMLWSVLHEGALRHMIGSPDVMREQLDKLIALARTPDVVMQVLPFTAGDHPGTDGPISVFDFADSPPVAYTECNGGGMIIESPDGVAELVTTLNMIRAAAPPPRDSLALLVKIRSEINDV
jgi:transcriptional regulator with XRE-family HTH domain